MKRLILLLLAVSPVHAEMSAFVNVNVVSTTDGAVTEGQTVLVDGDSIKTIGPVDSTAVPEGSLIIDGTDRFLVPGIAEMHAHIAPVGSASLDRTLELFAVNGVTTVRGMLGHPSHLLLRDELLEHRRLGPALVTSGPSLNGNSVAGAADGASKVAAQAEAGYDFLKLHPGLTRAEFDAIASAAAEHGIPFAGHVPVSVGVRSALAAGMATIDHLDGYLAAMLPPDRDSSGGFGGFFGVLLANDVDESQIDAMAKATAAAGTWNVPTQLLFENIASAEAAEALGQRPEMRYMPAATVQNWVATKKQAAAELDPGTGARAIELKRKLILALHRNGAGLLLGSDAPQIFNVPGFSAHRELSILVEAGLTPLEALQTGTTAAAEFLDLPIGSIEVGRRADLVLLDDNPLEEIANLQRIHGVMLRGRWISAGERADILARHQR